MKKSVKKTLSIVSTVVLGIWLAHCITILSSAVCYPRLRMRCIYSIVLIGGVLFTRLLYFFRNGGKKDEP